MLRSRLGVVYAAPSMRRRETVLLLAGLGSAACDGGVHASRRPTSVLLVVVDGLRADHVGCHGYPRRTTPSLDALAARGRRFANAVSPAPWSTPALAALLSGCYPSTVGLVDLDAPLADEALLLAELFAAEGYATGAVASHPFAAASWNLYQGFAQVREVETGALGEAPATATSAAVTDAALALIERAGSRPFFVLAHYADPLPEWIADDSVDFGDPAYDGPVRPGTSYEEILRRQDELTAADVVELAAVYDSEIARVDREIGRLLDGVDGRGRGGETLVLLTSLHGVELFDHGELGDAKTLYDELIHVPLVAHGPGVAPGVERAAVSLIDVAPTLVDLFGIPAHGRFDGVSLVLQGAPPERELFAETDRARSLRAVLSERWKLVHDLESGRFELYDLAADPAESTDLSESAAVPEARALEAALLAWEDGER